MGAGKSKDNIYYDPTINSELFDETRQCKFYRNHRGEQFEKYKVENKGQSDFENRYDYRIKNSSPYLVDAYSAKSAQNAFGCASGDEYQVVTERIPTRLFDLNNIPGRDALNLTNKALKGFQQIYKSQGVMLVKDSMIGINKQNKVKVWMNSNFALNQIQEPPISYGVLPEAQKESTMVDNIVELVNSRTKKDPQWVQFIDAKYRQGRIGFDQAIKSTQAHAARHNVAMGDNINTSNQANINNSQFGASTINQYEMKGSDHTFNPNYKQQTQVSSSYQSADNYQGPSMLKNSNPTVASSLPYPINTAASSSSFTPQFSTQQIGNRASVQPQSTMSNLKNKIINGGHQSNKAQNIPPRSRPISPVYNSQPIQNANLGFHPFPSTSIGSTLLPHVPQNSSLPFTQSKPSALQMQNRFTFNENQNNFKPRAISEGKPVVNFGGKAIASTTPSQFPSMINRLPAPSPINTFNSQNQTKQSVNIPFGGQSHQPLSSIPSNLQMNSPPNRYFPQSHQNFSSVSNTQSNEKLRQQSHQIPSQSFQPPTTGLTNVPAVQPLKLMYQNEPNQPSQLNSVSLEHQQQVVGSEQKSFVQSNQQVQANPYSIVGNSMTNLYPPPNQVVNFEKKIQITQSQYQNSVNNSVTHQNPAQLENKGLILNANVKEALGAIAGNLQSFRKSSQKIQKNQPTILHDDPLQSYFDEPLNFNNKSNSNQVKRAETFGNNNVHAALQSENISNFNSFNNNVSLAHSQEQKNTQYREVDTPVFDRTRKDEPKNQPYSLTFNKKLSAQSHEEDQMLAHEEAHLNLIKSTKAQNQVSELKQSQKLKQSKKLQQSQKLEESYRLKQSQKSQKAQPQIKSDNSIKQITKTQNEETDRQVNEAIAKLTSSVNKKSGVRQKQPQNIKQTPRESAKQGAKNETIFKKAVHQSASNIRMQSSKISIKNSGDLKGIISYKDLRDLLKTTRKYNH